MTTTVTYAQDGPLTANGTTPLPFTFQAISAEEIEVIREGIAVSPATYSVELSDGGTGSITPLTSWGTDEVYIRSAPVYGMPTEFSRHGAFYPDRINPGLDNLARQIIALKRRTDMSDAGESVLREDLLSLTGAEHVNFLPAVTGALSRRLESRLNDMISVKDFGAVGDGVADDTYPLQNAIDAVYAMGGGTIFLPIGTYLINGNKGARPVWTGGEWTHGGIIVRDGVELVGAGRDKTIIQNMADDWRCVLRVRSGANVIIRDLMIDGDWPNHETVALGAEDATHGSVRGEGIIYEGGSTTPTYIDIRNVHVRRTGHYGIGVQNVAVSGGAIRNVSFDNIGGDCIDLKHYPTLNMQKDLIIDGVVSMDGCGHNYLGGSGIAPHDNQAVVDIGGRCIVTNVFVAGLNSFGTQIGNTGVRARPDDVSNGSRYGAQGSTIANVYVRSNKLAAEGSSASQRIIGVAINASDVTVDNVNIYGCFYGFRSYKSGDNDILRGTYSNISVYDCTGAAADAMGVQFDASNRDIQVTNVRAKSCEIGISLSGQRGSYIGVSAVSCDIGLQASDAALANNVVGGINFDSNGVNMSAATVLDTNGYVVGGRDLAIVDSKGATLNFHSIFSGTWDTATEYVGGIRVYSTDVDGAGVAERASILARPSGSSGAGTNWDFYVSSSLGGPLFRVLSLTQAGLSYRLMPSDYADDAAAAAGGIAVGGQYRTGSILKVRVA